MHSTHIVAPHCHTRGSFVALLGTEGDPEANARLIIAAPDLLAALKKLLNATGRIDGFEDILGAPEAAARQAIARAKGTQ